MNFFYLVLRLLAQSERARLTDLAAANQRGCDVRYSTELVSFTQNDTGVTATLKERTTGRQYVIRSDYLVAKDDLSLFMITYRPALGEAFKDFTAERCFGL